MLWRKSILAVLILLLPASAWAQLDCILPTREQGFDARRPGAQALRRAAQATTAILQRNAVFLAGHRPLRVRTTIDYYGWDHLSASVIITAYNQKAWLAGGCKVSKFADRGGGLRDAVIAIYLNDPGSMLGGRLGDDVLHASYAPHPRGQFAGFPMYAVAGPEGDPRVLLSRAGYQPWVAVTVAEALAWQERDLVRRERDSAAGVRSGNEALDEAKIQKIYSEMAKVNAAEAEKFRAQMLAWLPRMRANQAAQISSAKAAMTQQRAQFDAYRASLTPAQLSAQARLGGAAPDGHVVRLEHPSGRPLAKIDPDFARRDPGRIHIISVALTASAKTGPGHAWLQSSYEALDFAALAGLLGADGR